MCAEKSRHSGVFVFRLHQKNSRQTRPGSNPRTRVHQQKPRATASRCLRKFLSPFRCFRINVCRTPRAPGAAVLTPFRIRIRARNTAHGRQQRRIKPRGRRQPSDVTQEEEDARGVRVPVATHSHRRVNAAGRKTPGLTRAFLPPSPQAECATPEADSRSGRESQH